MLYTARRSLAALFAVFSFAAGSVASSELTAAPNPTAESPSAASAPVRADLTISAAYQSVPVVRLADTRGDAEAALQVAIGRLTPGVPLELDLAGVAGIPATGVAAVDLNIAVTAATRTGFLAVYPCADGNDGTARLNFTNRPELGSSAIAVQVLAQLDADGATCIEASAPAHVIVDTSGFLADDGPFRPIPALRLFDTRTGDGEVPVKTAKPAIATPFPIKVEGIAGVPESGASAVLLSVAAVKGTAPGFVGVFPCADGYQGTANLNHRTNDPVANSVIAPLDENGEVCFYNSASVDLVVDISAWFAEGEAFGALEPSRAADSRDGVGGVPVGPLTPFEPLPIMLAGVGGVPNVGVEAVSLNVAVARGAGAGFLAVFPCDEEWNGTASLNFQLGEPISNAALTPIADDGTACVLSSVPVDVIIDINGWIGLESLAADDVVTIDEDAGNSQIDVLGNDIGATQVTGVTQAENGSVAITNGGADVRYIPKANFCTEGSLSETEPDTFTYTAQPGDVTASVSIAVRCVDDAPVAVTDSSTVAEDATVTVIDVLANDTDVDGGSKAISAVTQPASGTVVVTNAGADLTYLPDADYCNGGSPTDDFTYTVAPGDANASVSVTVSCVDDAPAAIDDGFAIAEDAVATTFAPLANDTDVDGGPKAVSAVTQPANGTVVVTNDGADLTYQPDADYCNDESLTDDFTYTAEPGGTTANVNVTVACVDDAPVVIDDSFLSDGFPAGGGPNDRNAIGNTRLRVGGAPTGSPERALVGSLLDNDADIDSPLTVADVQSVGGSAPFTASTDQGGSVTVAADGTFVYDPAVDFTGTDTFTYTVSDGVNPNDDGEVAIEVVGTVWYVDSSVDAVFSGSGTSSDPFSETNNIRSVGGDLDEPGDVIFLYQGDSDGTAANAYSGGLSVEENQHVIGEPAGLTIDGVALVAPDPGFPEVTSAFGAGIDVYGGARLDSVYSIATGANPGIQAVVDGDIELHDVGHSGSGTIGVYLLSSEAPITATGTIAIDGGDVLTTGLLVETPKLAGTVTIANVDIDDVAGDGFRLEGSPTLDDGAVTISDGTIDGGAGYGVNLVNGNGDVTIDADVGTTSSNAGPVRVFDRKGGDVSFGGSISDSSDNDLQIGGTNNTGTAVGSITFTGPITLQSATGIGGDGTGILIEGTSSVAAANAAMSVDFDGRVQVNGKINGDSIRVTGDSAWPVGTRTVRFDGGLEIATGATVASGLFVSTATVEVTDATDVGETIATNSGAVIASTNGSGTLVLDSVSGASMNVQHTLAAPTQHVDIDTIAMTGGNIVTVFLGSTNPAFSLDSVRIGGGTITSPNARGLDVRGVPSVDIDLTSIDVASDGPNTAAVFVTTTGGDIDVGSLAINTADDGLLLIENSATLTFGSVDIGDPGVGPSNRGVAIFDSTGDVDLGTGDVTSAGNQAFVVDGGSNDISYDGTITNTVNRSVLVRDRTGGVVDFGGLITHTGASTGIDTTSNSAGSTLRFTGGLDITSSNVGMLLTAGIHEIIDPVAGSNIVTATGGTAAVFLTSATLGAAGVTFESIDATSSTDGIVLNLVSGPGTFAVTGTGADGSGGELTVNTNGVELTSVTVPVVLTELSIAATSGSGIIADRSTSLTVDGVTITRWSNAIGRAGVSSIGSSGGARSVTLQGTNSRNLISNVPAGSIGSGVALTASAGDYDITVDATDFSGVTDGISLEPTGTARFAAVIGDPGADDVATVAGRVTSTGAAGAGVTVDVGPSSSSLLIDELSTVGVPGASFDSGIILTSGSSGQLDAVIEDSLLGGTTAHRTSGLFVAPSDGTIRTTVRRTTAISDVFDGMRFVATTAGSLDATIVDSTANGITDPGSRGLSVATTNLLANLCLDATNNTFSGLGDDLVIDQEPTSTFDVVGLTGGVNAAAVDAFLQVVNTYSSANSTFVGTAFGSATCALPVLP